MIHGNTISLKMLETLRKGKEKLSDDARQRIRRYIESQLPDDGIFMDRNGGKDIYYTAFGLMLMYVFDIKPDRRKYCKPVRDFKIDEGDLVHYASRIRSILVLNLMDERPFMPFFNYRRLCLTTPRRDFLKYPHDDPQAPYSQFALLSLKEDLHKKEKRRETILATIDRYKTPGGGYSNRRNVAFATTNATAAALSVTGQLNGYRLNEDVAFLRDSQDDSGGFFATGQAPAPDLLSTATALFVLNNYGVTPRVNPVGFIEAHWLETGCFAPTLLDKSSDIEYTFYGILALGTC